MAKLVAAAGGLQPKDAIAFLRDKTAVPTEYWSEIWREAHAQSFTVAGAASQALVDDFHREVVRAIENGTTLADFRKQFDAIKERHGWEHNGTPGWRAKLIYRTNLSQAYSAAEYVRLTAPGTAAVFPYWQYVHGEHGTPRHARPQHLAWNGLVLRCDDPFWNSHWPPNGWNCTCGVRPLMRHELGRLGKDGPDTAPPIEMVEWTDKRTGITHQVPKGIDPGFDYNPGQEFKKRGRTSVVTPASPPPFGVPPAVMPGALPPAAEALDPGAPPIAPARSDADLAREDAAMRARFAPVVEGLGGEQIEAMGMYQDDTFTMINEPLRAGDALDDFIAPIVADLDAVMAEAPALPAMTVVRGLRGEQADYLRGLAAGAIYEEKGFTSASLSAAVAERFAGDEGVVVELRIPHGYRGAFYMPAWNEFDPAEFELLLRRGLRFKVLSSEGPDGHHVVLEVMA
jgi:hypothetical protein